jgi:glycosyltransferase involved in cell wall biosynthesis
MFGKPVICSNVGAMADRVTDEADGLHFEMGDAAALARAMKRAATEPGLWQRLAGALPTPPSRSEMVDGFRAIYRAGQRDALEISERALPGANSRKPRRSRRGRTDVTPHQQTNGNSGVARI